MHDPQPIKILLGMGLLGVLLIGGWWLSLTKAERYHHLFIIWEQEHVEQPPPLGFRAQMAWLTHHRTRRLTAMVGLSVVALIIGISEGLMKRRTALYGGFLLTAWTLGIVCFPLIGDLLALLVLMPWVLPLPWAAYGIAGLSGLAGYGCCAGRPYIP